MTDYLRQMLEIKALIARKKLLLGEKISGIESIGEIIRRVSLGEKENTGMPCVSGGVGGDGIYRVWKKAYQELDNELKGLAADAHKLLEEEEKLAYVESCLRRLPVLQGDLIYELYVIGTPWEEYMRRKCISKSTLSRNRNRAMQNLLVIYDLYRKKQRKD